MSVRAFCCKARGGGGRLRNATGRMTKENVRWVLAVIKAKAVAVASACLFSFVRGLVKFLSYIILSITLILTHTPDWMKMEERFLIIDSYRIVH